MKGVIALELLMILMASMYFIAMINTGFQRVGFKFAEDFDRVATARAAVDKLMSAISFASTGGFGTTATLRIYIPEGTTIVWDGNTLIANVFTSLEYNNTKTHEIKRTIPLVFESSGSISGPNWYTLRISKIIGGIRVST